MFRITFLFLLLIIVTGCNTEYDQHAKPAAVKKTSVRENPAPDYINSPDATEPFNMLKKETVDRSDPENLIIDVTDTSTKISFLNKAQTIKSEGGLDQFIRSNKSKFKEDKICITAAGSTHATAIFHVMRILKKYGLKSKLIVD